MGGSIFDQRLRLAASLRIGSHIALGLLDDRLDRRSTPGRVTLTAVALGADLAHHRWLARNPARPFHTARLLLDSVEAVGWTLVAGASTTRARSVQVAHVIPLALEAGFRLGAGTEAVPRIEPARPFPPPRGRRGRSVVETVVPVAAPLVAHVVTRRARRWAWDGLREMPYPLFAVVGAFTLARYRHHQQHQTRRDWWDRAEAQVTSEQALARVTWATRSTPGHDFKKNLTALALAGSEAARAASHDQVTHPQRVAATTDGTTLLRVAMGIPISPPEASDTWIGTAQRRRLEEHIEAVDHQLEDRPPHPLLEVLGNRGQAVHLRYRGHDLLLTNPLPRLEAALDPTSAALAVGAVWKLLVLRHRVPRLLAVGAVAAALADVALLVLHHRARESHRDGRFLLTAAGTFLVNTALQACVLSSRPPTSDGAGNDLMFSTPAAQGLLGVLGSSRGQLSNGTARGLALWAVASWALADRALRQRPWSTLGIELVSLAQTYVASHGLTSRMEAEAEELETVLQAQFQQRVGAARLAVAHAELDRFRSQVDLAERELARRRDDLAPELAVFIETQCREVRAWLDDPETAGSDGS